MKILFLSHNFYPDIGGIEVNSEILAGYFTKFGAEVKVLTWSLEKEKKEFPFAVIRNPGLTEVYKLHIWADVVFENNPCIRLSWPIIFTGKKHVVALRTWIQRNENSRGIRDRLKISWLKKADALIAVSKAIEDETSTGATIIGNPYRHNLFKELTHKKTKDFVFLGRLVSSKGGDMALQLVARLLKDNPSETRPFSLTIIGDGPEKRNLKNMARELGITKNVKFKGFLEGQELVRCLNMHKYILIPSRWREPFGNIALEGLACGCLPIVSNGGGLVDAVGKAGIIFERNNPDSLYKEVKRLLDDPAFENNIRNNFIEKLKQHHPENVSRRYFEVIKRTLAINTNSSGVFTSHT